MVLAVKMERQTVFLFVLIFKGFYMFPPRFTLRLSAFMLCLQAGFVFAQDVPSVAEVHFSVAAYQVSVPDGLVAQEWETRLSTFVGANKSFADVRAAQLFLQHALLQAGFSGAVVQLPEQTLENGVVRLEVRLPSLSAIQVEGNHYYDEGNIRASLTSLHSSRLPDALEIGRNLKQINMNRSKNTRVTLKKSQDENIEALASVADASPWRMAMFADNTGSRETGKIRAGWNVEYNNLFNLDHSVSMQAVTSPAHVDQVKVFALNYHVPLYAQHTDIDLSYGYSSVDSFVGLSSATGASAGQLDLAGSGRSLGVNVTYYLPSQKSGLSQRLMAGLGSRLYTNKTLFNSVTASDNRVRSNVFTLAYQAEWKKEGDSLSAYLGLSQGFSAGSYSDASSFAQARVDAAPHFNLLKWSIAAQKSFAQDWLFSAAAMMQYSAHPLIAGEQFGLGGRDSVRGFLEREITGDRGYQYRAEVYSPNLWKRAENNAALRALWFIDGGAVSFSQAPYANALMRQSIASTGLGLRYQYTSHWMLNLDAATVLDAGGAQGRGDWMLHTNMSYSF